MAALVQPGNLPYPELNNTDYAAGVWYSSGPGNWSAASGNAMVSGTVSLIPFIPRFTHTFTALGWWHNSAAQTGHNLRLGIYDSTNGKPSGAALVDSGSIATTAAVAFRTSGAISQTLRAGHLYYLASNADSTLAGGEWTPPTLSYNPAWVTTGIIDPATAFGASATGLFAGFTQTSAYGAFPTIATLVDNAQATVNVPLIFLKG